MIELIQGNSWHKMRLIEDNKIDLTVTSPPYDELRTYNGNNEQWNEETWRGIIEELFRITKKGGVVVWVVGDETKKGSETGTSFKQVLWAMECGFSLHDTMIYEKNSTSFPARKDSNRYTQIFEFMFILSKGKPFCNLICDKKNKWEGHTNWGQRSQYDKEGNLNKVENIKPIPEFSPRNNIWKYSVGFNDKTGHPAVFPEELARDHILTWTKPGATVFDPFLGSGTTGKVAKLLNRNFIGIELDEIYFKIAQKRINSINAIQNEIEWVE